MSTTAAVGAAAAAAAAALAVVLRRLLTRDLGGLERVRFPPARRRLVQQHYPTSAASRFTAAPPPRTHYWLAPGAVTGEPLAVRRRLVLVHGISGSWASMPGVVDAFTKAGFDVLCYDLYGRGYSASPPIRYDADAYTAQLKNLLDAVGWETASILGYSLGGGIATHFTAIHPERVEDLVLVAPAGLRPKPPLAAKLITTPVLGPLFAYTIGRRVLVAVSSTRKHPKDVVNLPHMQHFIAVQNLNKLYHPGFMRAYVSTVKYGPIHGMAPFYARVAGSHCERVFCTWGRDDRVLSFRHDARVFRAMHPRATFVEMPGGHSVLVERTAEVVAPIVSFLNRRRVDGE